MCDPPESQLSLPELPSGPPSGGSLRSPSPSMRDTHPAARGTRTKPPRARISSVEKDVMETESGSELGSASFPNAPEVEFQEDPPYFADDEAVRVAFIAILETFLGNLDPDAEIVLPAPQVLHLNISEEDTEIPDAEIQAERLRRMMGCTGFFLPGDVFRSNQREEAETESQADRLRRTAEAICRGRASEEAGVAVGSFPMSDVAQISVTPEEKARITVNETALQFAERLRLMRYSTTAG
ncbi:hypothetical protein B0H10DRAFT_2027958 [Mycena sp. CBHHK59/15]|nr:hypothetical protein B0H10DRAFT_2027958 [Mycena sp. CBHHK59/15]